jgi:predicted DNA-binding transcriptional regulator YafY
MPADRSAQKLRRWIDLIVALLRRSGPASFNDFKGDVPSYATSDAAPESVLRTFERDKDELIRFGIPIEVSNDLKGVGLYRIKPGNFYLPMLQLGEALGLETPPRQRARGDRAISTLAFTPDELSLVVRAGRRVQQLGDPYLAAEASGALRKLAFELALPDDDGTEHVRVEPQNDDPAALDLLDNALRARKLVRFDYHSMLRDAHGRREVEPWGLVFLARHWYLLGKDHIAGALRRFRVRRITNLEIERARPHTPDFTVPDSFDITAYAKWQEAWRIGDGDAMQVTVHFAGSTGIAEESARLGAPVDGEPDHRRFEVRRPQTFARWLLRLAGDAQPVAPPEFVAKWRELAKATADIYGASR